METIAIDFLKSFTGGDTNCNINYRIVEGGRLIESIQFSEAVKRFLRDYEEMKELFSEYGIEEKAYEATARIWYKHIVVL